LKVEVITLLIDTRAQQTWKYMANKSNQPATPPASVVFLQLDAALSQAVRACAALGKVADPLQGTYITDEQATVLATQPAPIALPAASQQRLAHVFSAPDLIPFDRIAFAVCLAPAFDVRYEALYGYLQDDVTRRCATPNLILDLLCDDDAARLPLLRRFADDAPLMKHGLIERAGNESVTLLSRPLRVPDSVVMWLLDDSPIGNEDTLAAQTSAMKLSQLARRMEPRYGWDDLVLPDDQKAMLRELVATVQQRVRVLGDWGIGRKLASSDGVTALFAGPPGTGKTMAAEVMAHELRRDLYKIDLSAIVSKFIGETEKNLKRIFSEAERTEAILFFDEADAIFGKRSEVKDAHDRFANIEVSYLLQRMEAYNGITILATNLRANLDDAFTRRLHFAIDFPFPEAGDRLRIWQTLFPPELPREADLDFAGMAQRYKLAGGGIRNIIVSAAFLAASNGGVVTMAHLAHGARREMQKMGRLSPSPSGRGGTSPRESG
jgi:hypothetical protein